MKNEDCLKEFMFSCNLRKMSKRTMKGYRNNNLAMFKYVEQEFGITELEDMNRMVIQDYVNHLTEKGLKETYINGLLKCFRAYFNYALEEGYISRSPMEKIKFQREVMPIIQTFTDEEVYKMVRAFHGNDYMSIRNNLIMTLFLDTGIRCTELCDLQMTDIRDTHVRIFGKNKKERMVPISPVLNKALIRYLRCRNEWKTTQLSIQDEYLLLSYRGRKLTVEAVERVVRLAGESAKVREHIRCSPHTCRHYFAQKLYRNRVDVYTISKLLGHGNLQVTRRYLQSLDSDTFIEELGTEVSPLTGIMGAKPETKKKGGGRK
ncbi:MAG: tyrosine-type recombinase/integrase [Lachnospiraceae bacterium]|nr:tyrosine-type recombinase/integrase [Lachnospiraceae bacterium]